jgi:hypothetical protein
MGHARERLHEKISADYNDMANAATHEEVETRRTPRSMRVKPPDKARGFR